MGYLFDIFVWKLSNHVYKSFSFYCDFHATGRSTTRSLSNLSVVYTGLHNCIRPHMHTRIYLLTWPFSWCRKPPNWVWPSRLTKGKLMKTLWKADWFFFSLPPSLHYFHRSPQYSRLAAAELELITHLFNRLAEMWIEQQRMARKKHPVLYLNGLGERTENNSGIWIGWIKEKSGNCPVWPFDRNKLKSF